MASRSGIPGIPLLQRTPLYLEALSRHICYAKDVDFELAARAKCVYEDWTFHSVCSRNPMSRAIYFLKGSDQRMEFAPVEYSCQTDLNLARQFRDRLELAHWYIRVTQVRFGMWSVQLWRGDKSVRSEPDVETLAITAAAAETAAWIRAKSHEMRLTPQEKAA